MTDWPTDARARLEKARKVLVNLSQPDVHDSANISALLADIDAVLCPNRQPLGRLRLALKQLGDEASMTPDRCEADAHNYCQCLFSHAYYKGKAEAYRHALDLVMQMERNGDSDL